MGWRKKTGSEGEGEKLAREWAAKRDKNSCGPSDIQIKF